MQRFVNPLINHTSLRAQGTPTVKGVSYCIISSFCLTNILILVCTIQHIMHNVTEKAVSYKRYDFLIS